MNPKVKEWIETIVTRLLEFVFVIVFFILLYLVVTQSIPTENRDIANYLLGTLTMAVAAIVNYRWGSSAGSAKKTELMSNNKPENKPIT
jgi:ABC-type dipeptide/oligopeptide/nickel transport system permease subunit